ncbi:hypothetical protein FQN51_004262 [Onygenales sp. PD_10]|nr:hypothetical protein FQN51_004262 [Onygenales sp. PD_10]
MWKPPLNFITLHYAYIITASILSLVIIYPYGNLKAVDAYFFGASGSTESGLNTFDVKDLKTYQQVYIYLIPMFTNLGFINILVVVVRLHWFKKRLNEFGNVAHILGPVVSRHDLEASADGPPKKGPNGTLPAEETGPSSDASDTTDTADVGVNVLDANTANGDPVQASKPSATTISFAADVHDRDKAKALYVPPPHERDRGHPFAEVDEGLSDNGKYTLLEHKLMPSLTFIREDLDTEVVKANDVNIRRSLSGRLRARAGPSFTNSTTLERVASTMFVLEGSPKSQPSQLQSGVSLSKQMDLPTLSTHATVGRNSRFHNLTAADREKLGGIEYRSLKLLLKIVSGYFFGLHLFGALCLIPWILHADPKYRDYLDECGQGYVWWAFYSSQTMISNLGFTLTPDSMISFRDATWPMLLMTFLAFVGNTFYPCFLRFIIWVTFKLTPKSSSIKEPLNFLLKHPRRCYTLLFPSGTTWVLFSILFAMNFIDVLLIVVLDLDNPAVNDLPPGPRVLAALFQAASSRHTGTSTFNLAEVNPAVQFSLVVMMYIAILPIALSIRASNTYEETALGIYPNEQDIDEHNGKSYLITHIKNQLAFDLWYIFLGIFCVCISEAKKIMDPEEPLPILSLFFSSSSNTVSSGNVGLSLGHPAVMTSLSGQFTTFGKLVVCAVMIRGRHRTLPSQIDRAIMLPGDRLVEDNRIEMERNMSSKMKRYHTK